MCSEGNEVPLECTCDFFVEPNGRRLSRRHGAVESAGERSASLQRTSSRWKPGARLRAVRRVNEFSSLEAGDSQNETRGELALRREPS